MIKPETLLNLKAFKQLFGLFFLNIIIWYIKLKIKTNISKVKLLNPSF